MIDVLIGGGGYVGLTTAVALKAQAPHLRVMLVDAAPPDVWQKDERASAIAAAATRMLRQIGVWQAMADNAEPINEMIVTDSRTADPVRPVFLTFDGQVGEGEPFAHMVENKYLVGALRERASTLDIDIVEGTRVTAFEVTDSHVTVHFADAASLDARLLIAADGVRSSLREMAGIQTVEWPYDQSGIVTTVAHERPHNGRAEEHFLPAGPFAILPLTGNRSSIVWTESKARAQALLEADDMVFEAELDLRFGARLGALRLAGGRRAYPLGLTLARDFIASRLALVGDAAHGIHPIAGQGLNLGFKDAAALVETIVEADRLGLDLAAIDVLERYQRWRRFDTVQMGITTDVLNRVFSNDVAPVRALRDLGLGIVDRLPGLKSFFIRQAGGLSGSDIPRLLRGEPV